MAPGDELAARILESELMDDPEQAAAYAGADFAMVNQEFVDRFRRRFPGLRAGRAIDLGCGPADIPARLCAALPDLEIVAVDAARAMLATARSRRVPHLALVAARADALPFREASFDVALSNSLLHHLADPLPFWRTLRRAVRPGGSAYVMDLARPGTRAAAHAIVAREAGGEPEILRRDFYNSLLAAFTPAEVSAQIAAAGLASLRCEPVSDRHWLVWGTL